MADNIFLFVPNIIDYFRLITAFIAFYYMRTNYLFTAFWYLFSALLDEFDGHFARKLNQCSKFGAILDMVIDRCITTCFLAALCHFYPDYMIFFQLSMWIDIMSHWFHVQSSMMKGADSHKSIDLGANPILRHYYHNWNILFVMCSANHLFYCMLYLTYFTTGPFQVFLVLLYLSAPISILKTGISVLQFLAACQNIANIDVADRQAASAGQSH